MSPLANSVCKRSSNSRIVRIVLYACNSCCLVNMGGGPFQRAIEIHPSFPSSAWERTAAKFRFAGTANPAERDVLRRSSVRRSKASGSRVPKQSLGTRGSSDITDVPIRLNNQAAPPGLGRIFLDRLEVQLDT